MSNCLICANPQADQEGYHLKCLRKLFGSDWPPVIDYNPDDMAFLAQETVQQGVTIPGVQAKLYMEIQRQSRRNTKQGRVEIWRKYILKPPSLQWPQLPENEHCSMMMADALGIETVPFGLIELGNGELAYITRRIDRDDKENKFAMEDMCQLSGRLTKDKYNGSFEEIGEIIKKYSANPIFDLTRFFEVVLFSYITGNTELHFKNFSLFKDPVLGWKLSPAYGLLSPHLFMPDNNNPTENSLTLAGKKNDLHYRNFIEFGFSIGLNKKQMDNIIDNFASRRDALSETIVKSFLNEEMKAAYHELLQERNVVLFS